MLRSLLALVAAALCVGASLVSAQTLRVDPFFTPELRINGGEIYAAVVQSDGKIIAGGKFTWVNGTRAHALARFNADGSLDPTFSPQIENGAVYALALQTDGRVVVGGTFTRAGGQNRLGLVRLLSNGTVDAEFSTSAVLNGPAVALALDAANAVYVGGLFTQAGGMARTHLAKFSTNGVIDTAFNPALSEIDTWMSSAVVNALAVLPGNRLAVAGRFRVTSGVLTGGVVVLGSGGSLDPNWSFRSTSVVGLGLGRDTAGNLYAAVGGTYYDGSGPRRVLRFNTNLGFDAQWNPELDAYFQPVAIAGADDGSVYLGGAVSSFYERSTGSIVRILVGGQRDGAFRSGELPPRVTAIARHGNKLAVVGLTLDSGLGAVAGTIDAGTHARATFPVSLQTAGYARAVLPQTDGGALVGGRFDAIGEIAVSNLARIGADGRVAAGFAPIARSETVMGLLAQPSGRFLVRTATDSSYSHTAIRFNADGSRDSSFQTLSFYADSALLLDAQSRPIVVSSSQLQQHSATGTVEKTASVSWSDLKLATFQPSRGFLFAGSFTRGGPDYRAQPHVMRYRTDFAFDADFVSPFQDNGSGQVSALRVGSDGRIYIAGNLTFADGAATRLARLNEAGVRELSYPINLAASESVTALRPRANGDLLLVTTQSGGSQIRTFLTDGTEDVAGRFLFPLGTISEVADDGIGGAWVAGTFELMGSDRRFGLARLANRSVFARLNTTGVAALPGETVSVGVELSAPAGVTFQWRRNGVDIPSQTAGTLTLTGFDAAQHVGSYTLVVTHAGVQVETAPAVVALATTPVIVTQPRDVLESIGGRAEFRVASTATPAPTYQWRKDGAPVAGATGATLSIAPVRMSDEGVYSVTVSNRAGSVTSAAVRLRVETTTLDRSFSPRFVAVSPESVNQFLALSDGRAVAAGTFTAVNGTPTSNLVALRADGSLNAQFVAGASGTPRAILPDGRIVVVGPSFYNGSQTVQRISLLESNGAIVPGFSFDLVGSVERVHVAGSALLLRGYYLSVNNVPVTRGFARILLSGTVDSSFSFANGLEDDYTFAGSMSDGRLYAMRTRYNNSNYSTQVVRLLANGAPDPSFTQRTFLHSYSYSPSALVLADGRLVISFSATTASADIGPRGLVRLSLSGAIDTAFAAALPPRMGDEAQLFPIAALPDGRLIVRDGQRWLRLQVSGAVDPSFSSPAHQVSDAVGLSDGGVIARNVASPRVEAVLRLTTTGEVSGVIPRFGVQGSVAAARYQPGGRIYVSGEFDWVNSTPARRLSRLEASGELDSTFKPAIALDETVVASVVQADGRVVAAGKLRRHSSDTLAPRVLRFESDGTRDRSFAFTFDKDVLALAVQADDTIVAVGAFGMVENVARSRVARLLPSGTVDLSFRPPFRSDSANRVAVDGNGRIAVVYTQGSSYSPNDLVQLTPLGAIDSSWPSVTVSSESGIVFDLQNRLLVSSSSMLVMGARYSGVVRLLPTGQVDPNFATGGQTGNASVLWHEPDTGKTVVAGGLRVLAGHVREWLGRVTHSGAFDPSLQPSFSGATTLSALTGRSDGDLLAGGAFTGVDGLPVGGLARWIRREFSITFPAPVRALSPGAPAEVQVTVQGTGPFSYQWRKDGIDLPGQTGAALALPSVTAESAGSYTLRVSNGRTVQTSDPLRIVVSGAPTIVRQPTTQSADVGSAAVFSVEVRASPAASFQWRKDGVALPGATNASLLLPAISRRDAGAYSVAVSNGLGSVLSDPAYLAVTGMQIDEGFRPTFSLGGTEWNYQSNTVSNGLVLADGRMLVGGSFQVINGAPAPFLARLNADGSVDRSYVSPSLPGSGPRLLFRLRDGKILVLLATYSTYTQGVVALRLQGDGTLDETFPLLRAGGSLACAAEDATGRLYLGGEIILPNSNGTQRLIRLTPKGEVDGTFAPNLPNSTIVGIALQPDGVIVATNYSYSQITTPLARYTLTGERDAGWVPVVAAPGGYSSYSTVSSVLGLSDGSVLVAGYFGSIAGVKRGGVARLLPDRTVDLDFRVPVSVEGTVQLLAVGTDRFALTGGFTLQTDSVSSGAALFRLDGSLARSIEIGSSARLRLVDALPDGSVLTVGQSASSWSGDWRTFPFLLRIGPTGAVAHTSLALNPGGSISRVAALPDGRLIAVGNFATVNGTPRLRLVRLMPGGAVDPAFTPVQGEGVSSSMPTINAVLLQPDGKLVLAGAFSEINGVARSNLARINPDGSLDATWNPSASSSVRAIARDANGRLLVAGSFQSVGGGFARRLARLLADGTLDPGFRAVMPDDYYGPSSVLVAPGNRVLVGMEAQPGVIRFEADGTRDPTFLASVSGVSGLHALPDGRILINGLSGSNGTRTLHVLHPDGARDLTFGSPTLSGDGWSMSAPVVWVQADGRIVLGGSFFEVNGVPQAGLARLMPDGRLDTSLRASRGPMGGEIASLTEQPDGSIIIAGSFTSIGDMGVTGIARFIARPFTVRVQTPEVIAPSGAEARFAVEVKGDGTFSYVWKKAGAVVPGASAAQLAVTTSTTAAGSYVCEVTQGVITVVTDPMTLVVGAAPVITQQPQSVLATSSTGVKVQVLATGSAPLAYQWYRGGSPLAGATSATLDIASVSSNGSDMYWATATNAFGQATSRPIGVHIGSAPQISYRPSDVRVTEGTSLQLYVSVSGSPQPAVQWQRNGVDVPGLAGSSATISAATLADAGSYTAVVRNIFGSITSQPFSVAVDPAAAAAPVISVQPASQTVQGNSFTLSVVASGNPTPTYQWRLNGSAIPGATWASYSDYSGEASAAGDYVVEVKNSHGSVLSNVATITLQRAPVITSEPGSVSTGVNTTVSFTTRVSAAPAATLQWRKDNMPIAGATTATLTLRGVQAADAGSYDLVATNAHGTATSRAATLTLITTPNRLFAGATGRGASSDASTVLSFTIEGTEPKRVLLRALGPTLSPLGVAGAMADPELTLYDNQGGFVAHNQDWGTAANAADVLAAVVRLGVLSTSVSSKDAALLVLLAPGTYTGVIRSATGASGTVLAELYETDNTFRLVHISLRGRVSPTQPLTLGFTINNYGYGRPFLMRALGPQLRSASALADPVLNVYASQTRLGGNDDWGSPASETMSLTAASVRVGAGALPTGSKDAALLATLDQWGSYVAQATSADTNASGDVLIEVFADDGTRPAEHPPMIAAHPDSSSADVGATVTLAALAHGRPSPTYQWRKDGAALPGQTNATLTLSSLQHTHVGQYTVVATNALGTATSLPAAITVGSQGPATATHAIATGSYAPGSVITINNVLQFTGVADSAAWSVTLPEGWVYDGGTNEGMVKPSLDATGRLEWSWTNPPTSPLAFSYRIRVPDTARGIHLLPATVTLRTNLVPLRTFAVAPDPLRAVPFEMRHTADTDFDGRISLTELTRVIELFNSRNASARTGCYRNDPLTEDGFAADSGRAPGPVTLARYHSADSNRDGAIDVFELTRVIQLYNVRQGATRTGYYRNQLGTEDGFAPGP
jgi:uncharacterized delta-60 repeat protein